MISSEDDDDGGELPDGYKADDFAAVDVQLDHARWAMESAEGAFRTIRRSAAFVATVGGLLAGLLLRSGSLSGLQMVAATSALVAVGLALDTSYPQRWNDPEPLPWFVEQWDPIELKRRMLQHIEELFHENAKALKRTSRELTAAYIALGAAAAIIVVELGCELLNSCETIKTWRP